MSAVGELDEFRLVRPLGKGGMGEVYLGHDTVLERPVAIKLIGSRNPDASSRERFLTEARAIARLSHPNVVAIFRVGTTADGRPFLVQELIRGRSLDRVARPVPWREVCEIAIGIARGLEAAHRRGILHRDIKPANVMLDENGTARLLDFGLAKLGAFAETTRPIDTPSNASAAAIALTMPSLERRSPSPEAEVAETRAPVAEARAPVAETRARANPNDQIALEAGSSRATATEDGAVLGTPRYTAPENWRSEPSTTQSDLYSLGALVYELLTGVPPFPQTDVSALRDAVLAGQPPPIAELAPETHPALARVVMRCLATLPRDRPGSAAEVVHELEALLVDAPAVPEGNPYRGLRAFGAEHRGLFFGRGADVSVLVDRLRTESLVVVVGDSGIGKSSVVHAGVAPAIVAGGLGDRRTWRVATVVPGRSPWTALRDALALPNNGTADPQEVLRGLRVPDGEGILLVIDQLEELVTLSPPAEAERVAAVVAAIGAGVPGIKAVLAVRGDFLTRVAALTDLGGPMTRGLHLLRVLSAADLREAVVGPARAKGVRYETETMIDELVAAVADNPGALPLLQFTLAELWQARDVEQGVIPAAALAALGGVDGGLARHGDAVLFALTPPQRAAARRILLRLVSSSLTRAVREREELVGDDPVAGSALEALVRGRLVIARDTLDGTPSYELAHEALIRSWGTLRDWLDAAAGQHAARNRLIASAAEWDRLERKPELLWSRRQLDEVRDVAELTAKELAFVDASRGLLRRRRIARVAAIAAVPLIAIAIFAGVRFDAARRRDRAIATRVNAATKHHEVANHAAAAAAQARAAAFAAFDRGDSPEGEGQWMTARRKGEAAQTAYRDAAAELEAAHLVGGDVREQMLSILWQHAELAEAEHAREHVRDLLRRIEVYDPARAASWQKPALLHVRLDRVATIAVHAQRRDRGPTIAGGFDREPITSSRSASLDLELAPGSYVVVVTDDGRVVRDPVMLSRGELLERTLAFPTTVPDGYVHIPAGRFLFGSDREDLRKDFLFTQPLHAVHLDAYLIGRTEVALRDWLEFLRALPDDERRTRTPKTNSGSLTELEEKDGRYTIVMKQATAVYRAAEGEPIIYPDRTVRKSVRWELLPVTGVSWEDAHAYAKWLDSSGRLPGARLCAVREWERAARGADGRSYPHGETLEKTDANIDITYDRKELARGPDEVGSFPASDSPFGVADLAGNVWDMVVGPPTATYQQGEPWAKGGSWFHGKVTALATNRNISDPKLRDPRQGIRICANAGAAR